ncbi:UNVERIFIED_CONTAM: hypothetical protein PYX00_000307 [Menopon gallinae]|uniref:Transposase n=1 Tax=Menopon gallinae TaxID=328185 RepID=A0AAW2I986_9NEOP
MDRGHSTIQLRTGHYLSGAADWALPGRDAVQGRQEGETERVEAGGGMVWLLPFRTPTGHLRDRGREMHRQRAEASLYRYVQAR